jgi:hypothetical protein
LGAIALRLVSNGEIARREAVQQDQSTPHMLGLARHIANRWSAAQRAKVPIDSLNLANLRQRNGEYSPSKLAEIRAMGGSEIYMMLTSMKCRAAEALCGDILLPMDDKAWSISPTPMPSLPPIVEHAIFDLLLKEAAAAGFQMGDDELDQRVQFLKTTAMQRLRSLAEEIAAKMEARMHDQLIQGGWYSEFPGFLYDFVTFKAAIMKGPILRKRKQLTWGQANGRYVPVVKEAVVTEFERRSPFNIYPAPRSRGVQHSYLFDKYEFTREDLQALKGVPGYKSDAIDEALSVYGERGYETMQYRRYELGQMENRPLERLDPEGPLETVNYWGSASGRMLLEWGDDWDEDIDPDKEYQIEAWQLGHYTIKATLNSDPLGRKPYSKVAFEEIPGTFWGNGLPEVLRDAQDMCNAAARSIANNMAIASGPQVEINVDRLADGAPITKLYPWKLHQTTTDPTGNNQAAVRFFQPTAITQELIMVYTHFERIADEVSGIPNYTYGDSHVGGAGRTASGLSMLMGNASKGVKRLVKMIDTDVTEDRLKHLYEFNMEHDPDPSIKGDLQVVAKGVRSLMLKEQMQMRRAELLQATNNPIDAQIMGMDGRRELLRETIKGADLPADKIVKSPEALALEAPMLPQPHEMAGGKGPNGPGSAPGGGQGGGGPPGMSPGGGTPQAPATLDQAGNPAQGQDVKAFRDGGLVINMPAYHERPARKMILRKNPADGSMLFEEQGA